MQIYLENSGDYVVSFCENNEYVLINKKLRKQVLKHVGGERVNCSIGVSLQCIRCHWAVLLISRQTDRYFIDRKKVITDLFVIEMIYVHVYTRLLIC